MEHSLEQLATNHHHTYCANPLTIPIDKCICVCFNFGFNEFAASTPVDQPYSSYLLASSSLSSHHDKELLAALIFTKIFLKSIFYYFDYLTLVRKCFDIPQLVLIDNFKSIFCDIEYRSQSNSNSIDSERCHGMTVQL